MPIRIGVIGTGMMGADHIETITTAVSGAEVCCIADIDARRAEVIASRFPGAKALSSAESLIVPSSASHEIDVMPWIFGRGVAASELDVSDRSGRWTTA